MLKAIWPGTARIPNHLPEGANITTVGMMTYFLYWLFQFPFMLVSPQKIRHLFMVKAFIVPCAWLAILIWAMVKAPPSVSLQPKHAEISGSALSWAWLSALNSALGIYATLAVNVSDFTRYGARLGIPHDMLINALFQKIFNYGTSVSPESCSLLGLEHVKKLRNSFPLRCRDQLLACMDQRLFLIHFAFLAAELGHRQRNVELY